MPSELAFHVCTGRKEAAFSRYNRKYGVRVIIEFPQSSNGFGNEITAKGIQRLRAIELSSKVAKSIL